jgi:hypothetical protein
MPTLWEPQEAHVTGVLIRSAIADALRAWGAGMSWTETVGALRPPQEAATEAGLGMIPIPEMGRIREDR